MAGNWAIFTGGGEEIPEPRSTTRLRLVSQDDEGLVADLSAMTVTHGTIELYETKRAALGQDPLREDCDPQALWKRVASSGRSIGALIMDQSFFTGPGNIYRAEILFKASVHPNTLGKQLERPQFDAIWHHTVALLRRGFETGSIMTVDPQEAAVFGPQHQRRYIYNQLHCPRCQTRIVVWGINSRTCYACPTCQPVVTPAAAGAATAAAVVTPERPCEPFHSHCARDSLEQRLSTPGRLTVAELRNELLSRGMEGNATKGLKKAQLVDLLQTEMSQTRRRIPDTSSSSKNKKKKKPKSDHATSKLAVSSEEAAREKARAGESLAVEHTAELAPVQARRVRALEEQQPVEPKRGATAAPKRKKTASRGNSKRSKV
eukprot:scaffold9620_cov197-Amphora_coffeaeformis.AAC.7